MTYRYKCIACGKVEMISNPISEKLPESVPCSCGSVKKQDFTRKAKSLSLKTPESFKAGSPYAPKDYTEGGSSLDLEALGY